MNESIPRVGDPYPGVFVYVYGNAPGRVHKKKSTDANYPLVSNGMVVSVIIAHY